MTLNILWKRRQLLKDGPREADRYVELFQFDATELAADIGGFKGKRVLDVGCGLTYPHVTIFQCLESDVTGVDIDVIDPRSELKSVLRLAGRQGVTRTARDYTVARVFNPVLSSEICRRVGGAQRVSRPDIREGDAMNLGFADGTFDVVYTHAVYEHIPDIGRALDEARRTLKVGGVMRLAIHLYPSLTGGHTGKVGRPGENVPPWDHLRERRYPPTSYLNELREKDYRTEIERRFVVIRWIQCRREQDVELLTEDIEKELAEKGYSRDELLTETIVAHLRKPNNQVSDGMSDGH
jgi:SAM-dependent methyltransferase